MLKLLNISSGGGVSLCGPYLLPFDVETDARHRCLRKKTLLRTIRSSGTIAWKSRRIMGWRAVCVFFVARQRLTEEVQRSKLQKVQAFLLFVQRLTEKECLFIDARVFASLLGRALQRRSKSLQGLCSRRPENNHIYIYIYIHTHTYIHTYIHTHTYIRHVPYYIHI